MKGSLRLLVVLFFSVAQASYADLDHRWLPNISGLPPVGTDADFRAEKALGLGGREASCRSVDPSLRAMFFHHFKEAQVMLNAQNVRFTPEDTRTWAHVLAMIVKESSGDSTDVTDMRGHEVGTYRARTNLAKWSRLFQLSSRIQYSSQTNFGLSQSSADRLKFAFSLSADQQSGSRFLNRYQDSQSQTLRLDTAIATRRLIWLYQDFAQGRLTEQDHRIPQAQVRDPKYESRMREGLRAAVWHCGTKFLFEEGSQGEAGERALENAMASIAYCKLGSAQAGYGKNLDNWRCFAQWVTLCPALNIDIATLTPASYFQTRHSAPVCQGTLNGLLSR